MRETPADILGDVPSRIETLDDAARCFRLFEDAANMWVVWRMSKEDRACFVPRRFAHENDVRWVTDSQLRQIAEFLGGKLIDGVVLDNRGCAVIPLQALLNKVRFGD